MSELSFNVLYVKPNPEIAGEMGSGIAFYNEKILVVVIED
jgi:hypothetical protein